MNVLGEAGAHDDTFIRPRGGGVETVVEEGEAFVSSKRNARKLNRSVRVDEMVLNEVINKLLAGAVRGLGVEREREGSYRVAEGESAQLLEKRSGYKRELHSKISYLL